MNVLTNQRSVFTYLSSTPVAMLSSLMLLSISLDLSSSSPNMNLNQSEISRARCGPIRVYLNVSIVNQLLKASLAVSKQLFIGDS